MGTINKKYEKEEKRNKADIKKVNKPVNVEEYRKKFLPKGFDAEKNAQKFSASQARQAYNKGVAITYTSPSGKKSYYAKGINGSGQEKRFYANRYQNTKPEEMNLAQRVAYMRDSGASQEEYQLLADAIQNPSSAFYNPYWKGRSTQTAAMDFFRSYFGTDDIRFDQQFFDDNIGLRQFTKRSDLTHNLSQPTQKDSEDVWAAYFYESLLADKEYSDNATTQWNQLRSDAATFYNDYQTIHGRKPTMEEFLDSIDITDYSVLYSMDASRNIGSDKSSKVVQLNSGCNYSNEGLVGLYSVLSSGGDISEDRDYFEDAVQYYMQPYEEAAARKTMLAAMGFDTSGWSEEDYAREMQKARKAGDSATYEALKQDRWQNGEHMDSVDTTDYLGERFGYNKDAKYFSDIRSVYQPIWNEMYTDSSRSSIKKPNSSDSEVYHAAYQAWQECQGEELLNKVEDQAEAFLGLIDIIDTSRWDTQEEYEDYYNKVVAPALESEEYSDLRRYMAGDLSLVRDVFISEDEIKEYVQRHWNGDAPETAVPENEPKTVVMDPEETPLFYEFQQSQNAANDAAKRSSDATKIGQALLGLSESGSSISSAMLAEKGISVFWGDAVENGEIKNTLIALWRNLKADGYAEKLGDEATFGQKMSIDPVLKMVAEDVDLEAYNHHQLTMDGLYDLIEQQTTSQMSGSDITVADGVIAAAIPDANELFSGIERGRNRFGQNNTILSKSEFDLATYNDVYSRCRARDFSPEDSADIAIDAAIFGNSGLKAMSAGLESDAELTSAANSVASKVTAEEGYPEAVAVVGPVIAEVVAAEDDEILAAEAKDLGASVLLGMSQEASPLHSAATKNFLFEVLRGDISTEDIVAGIKNSAKGLVSFGKQISEGIGAYGDELRILGYSNGIITTEKYDALDDESKVIADELYNQSIGDIAGDGEIINGIIARAAVNGHDDIYGTDKNKVVDTAGEKVMANDALLSWLGTVTSLSSETTQEQYKVEKDLRNYGKWLTYDEASALMSAWQQGYITYDDFNSIIMDRVSLYSNSYVNGMKNIDQISDSIQIARDGLDDLEAGINHNLEIAETGMPDDVVSEAESALRLIGNGNDPVMLVRSNSLAETIGLDSLIEQHGDDEGMLFIAIDDALRGIVEGNTAANVMDDASGYDFTLPQVDELRKVVDLYEQFGAYGYEFISSATPEFLENFDIDLAGVGLEGSVADYMDKLTGSKWRDAYRNKGIGVIDTIGTGGLSAFQQMGNIWVGGKRIINDVLEFLPGITTYQKGDGSYYDRNQSMNSKVGETLETQATGFEKFASGIISETVRNQTTGFIGAALGNMKSAGDFARYMGKAVSSVPSMNTVANVGGTAQLAASVLKADRLIDSTTILSRLPFVSSVFTGAYSENKDQGKGVFRSIIRASTDTMIELFTETPAVDDKLNAAKNWILPKLDAVDNGMFEYILKTGSDAFNEIGQEELSLVAGKVFDMIESFEGENVTGVSSFFHEMWDTIQRETEGIGAEAASTAVSTFFVTLLGSVWNIPGSLTKIKLNEYRMNDSVLTQQGFEEMCEDAAFELMEAYTGGENAQEEANARDYYMTPEEEEAVLASWDAAFGGDSLTSEQSRILDNYNRKAEEYANRKKAQEEAKTETKDKGMPAFDRTKGAVYGAAKDMLMGKATEQDVAQAIEDTMSNPAPSVEQPAEEQAPEQAEEPVEAEYQPDPNLSAGANKVAAYINEAEAGKRDAVAAEVGRNVVAEFLENDGTIKAAEKVVETAQAVYNKATAAANEIHGRITENKQRLQMIFSAAADEGRDFNSPDVQNAVVANQQATSALESDYAENAKAVEEAAEAVTKAQNDLEETRTEAEKLAAAEAKKKEDESKKRFEEAKAVLRTEAKKQVVVPADEASPEKREYTGVRLKSDAKGKKIDNGRFETEEDESITNINTNDRYESTSWDDVPEEETAASAGVDKADYSTDFDLKVSNLADVFNKLVDDAEENALLYQVNVPKKLYSKLIGIFERMPNGEKYIDVFFRHSTNSEKNADALPVSAEMKKTIEEAKDKSAWKKKDADPEDDSSDSKQKILYDMLRVDFGMTPIHKNDSEIIMRIDGEQKGISSPKVIQAENELRDARQKLSDLKVVLSAARSVRNATVGEGKKSRIAFVRNCASQVTDAENLVRDLESKYQQIYEQEFGFVANKYAALKINDIEAYINEFAKKRIDAEIDVGVQEDKLIEHYKAGRYTSEHLREILAENYGVDGMSEENASAIRKNISGMSDNEVIEEIVSCWREAAKKDAVSGLLGSVPYTPFNSDKEVTAYINANGGRKSAGGIYDNLKTEQSYYVNSALLALVNQYKNMLRKGDEADYSAVEISMEKIDDEGLEGFLKKIVDLGNKATDPMQRKNLMDALGIPVEVGIGGGKRYLAVDVAPFGTLRVTAACKNNGLKDAAGNFLAERADFHVKKALNLFAKGYDSDYTLHVAEEVEGKRVIRQVGGYYKDLDCVYCPTYAELAASGAEVYLKHTKISSSGREYADLDFSVSLSASEETDVLKKNLDEAERSFMALFSASERQPSEAEFGLYAERYLRAKAEVLNREIFEAARDFRLHGDKFNKDPKHTIRIGEEIKAKKEELAQIRTALNSDEGLQEFISGYRFGGTGANREELQAVMEDMAEKVDHNSPEMQAAIELLENTPEQEEAVEAPETADSSAKREIAAKVDKTLTEGMSPEERATYYAERANDAMLAGDTQRYEQYNREVANAAEEIPGETDESEPNQEVEPEIDPVQQAMEEYEVSPENEAIIDTAYPERNATEEEEQSTVQEPIEVDENTILNSFGSDAETIKYGKDVILKQNQLVKELNKQIDSLAPQVKIEWEAGAKRWKERNDEIEELQERLNSSKDAHEKQVLRRIINQLHTERNRYTDGKAAFDRWTVLVTDKKALEARRNTAKQNMKANTQYTEGTMQAKQLAEGNVQYTPFTPIVGSKGNKNGSEIAKAILKEAYSGNFVDMKYSRKTALTVEQVANLISVHLDKNFYEAAIEYAKIITAARKSAEMDRAADIFRLAVIDERLGYGKAEEAKNALIDAYQDGIKRDDFTREGYQAYQAKRSDAREEALVKADDILKEYAEGKSAHALNEERTKLTKKIEQDTETIANMLSSERANYRLGNGDVVGALRGDYGGQIPVPLMNIFTGMVYNASQDRKAANTVTREFDNTKRIVDAYLGEYAPFINAVFIIPAQRANDAQKAESTQMRNDLLKKLPKKQIEVTVEKDGNPVVQDMSLREIVGHIIDERTNKEFAEIRESDYVQTRLSMYGITDSETRQQIIKAVDAARAFNDDLYLRANDELVKNGHYNQTYNYRRWYMHHYNNEGDNQLLARFGIHTSDDEISQVFVDDTGNRRPSHQFNAAALERHGNQTGYDFYESVDRSLDSVMNTIYQTGNIDRLKQLEQAINGTPKMDEEGNYVYENNKVVLESRPMFEVGADGKATNKNHLVGFGNTIGQFAQRAANKRTGKIDRAIMDSVAGRKAMSWLKFATSMRSAAAVAINPMSAVTNIAPVKFLAGICTPAEIVSAMASTVNQMSGKAETLDYISEHSNFVKGRTEHSAEERAIQSKVLDAGYAMSAAVDKVTTNFMARALFNHEMNTNGGDAKAALVQTEDMLRAMMTDKSRVGRSQFYENTSLGGLLGQFQQESVNELMYMFKDMKYYGGSKVPKALVMLIGVYIFNGLFNYLRGSDGMPDPIGAMIKEHNSQDENASLYDKGKGYAGALIETINPVDFFTSGEVATVSSVKDVIESVDSVFSGEATVWDFFGTLGSTLFPGGTTIKRGITGIKSVQQGYAETASGNVKFTIDNSNPWKYVSAAVGGVNVLSDSKAYNYGFDEGMQKTHSTTFRALLEAGLDAATAWRATMGTKAAKDDTADAGNIATIAGVTEEETSTADAKARQSREEAGMPSDISGWGAAAFAENGNNAVKTGIQAWVEYGVDTYPKEITTETFGLDDTSYIRQNGVAHPLDEQDYAAINALYKEKYEQTVKLYGRINSPEAAKELEKALNKIRTEARNEYMQKGYFERERGEE